jgi:hypothetical protein
MMTATPKRHVGASVMSNVPTDAVGHFLRRVARPRKAPPSAADTPEVRVGLERGHGRERVLT